MEKSSTKFCLFGNSVDLTPVLELKMRLSCPDEEENDSFKFPGPISIVSFCGRSVMETKLLGFPALKKYNNR